MPAFYVLGQHNAPRQAAQKLHPDDVRLAFLDDLYLLTRRDRVRSAIDTVTAHVERMAGVQTHLGKLESGVQQAAQLHQAWPS